MVRKTGKNQIRLESFRWEKPGVATATYVYLASHDEGKPTTNKEKTLFGVPMKYQGYSFRHQGSHVEYRFSYRGALPVPRGPTDRSPGGKHGEQWGMDISLNKILLTAHPDIDKIMSDYRGVMRYGAIEFPPYVNGNDNPFYGVRDFYSPNVILRVQRVSPASGAPKASQLNELGYTDAPNDTGFGFVARGAGGGRSPWLKVEYSYRVEGEQAVEVEAWRYAGVGGRGGWLNEVYRQRSSYF
jgi:hypothetical protein